MLEHAMRYSAPLFVLLALTTPTLTSAQGDSIAMAAIARLKPGNTIRVHALGQGTFPGHGSLIGASPRAAYVAAAGLTGELLPTDPTRLASGIKTRSPTTATTTTQTTTFGSVKFWPPTTSAAAMLRWAVPSASTLFVSCARPPSSQPRPKPTSRNRTLARTPRVPNRSRMLRTFVTSWSTIIRTRLTVETRLRRAAPRPAACTYRDLTASPIASGTNISNTSDRAIFAASTETPLSNNGRTNGM